MESEQFLFADSCKTLISNKNEIFVSAFPGKIVFGKVNQVGYKKSNFFKFFHFEIFHFFVALTNIFKFLSSENTANKGIILTLDTLEVYYWIGKELVVTNQNQKIIVFGIEENSQSVFEINLKLQELNELIHIVSQTIISCLCLKSIEKQLFENIVQCPTSEIVQLKDYKQCEQFIQKFEKSIKVSIDSIKIPNLIDIVIYYHELLLIVQKLKSMCIGEDTRIEAILEL